MPFWQLRPGHFYRRHEFLTASKFVQIWDSRFIVLQTATEIGILSHNSREQTDVDRYLKGEEMIIENPKCLSTAEISVTCANYLTDIGAPTGKIWNKCKVGNQKQQHVRFATTSLHWTKALMNLPPTMMIKGEGSGSLLREFGEPRAFLSLNYDWFNYSEHKNGSSRLVLFDYKLPETVCAAYGAQGHRLLDLVDFSEMEDMFLVRSNPTVVGIANGSRVRTILDKDTRTVSRERSDGLLITMEEQWSTKNWPPCNCDMICKNYPKCDVKPWS